MSIYLGKNKIGVTIKSGIKPEGEIAIIENGTYDVTNYANAVVNVEGAGGETSGEYFVKVIDYDGTILKEAHLDTGDTFTLPTPPSHNGFNTLSKSSLHTITPRDGAYILCAEKQIASTSTPFIISAECAIACAASIIKIPPALCTALFNFSILRSFRPSKLDAQFTTTIAPLKS
jgi:hypothetical protein